MINHNNFENELPKYREEFLEITSDSKKNLYQSG